MEKLENWIFQNFCKPLFYSGAGAVPTIIVQIARFMQKRGICVTSESLLYLEVHPSLKLVEIDNKSKCKQIEMTKDEQKPAIF